MTLIRTEQILMVVVILSLLAMMSMNAIERLLKLKIYLTKLS